MNHSTLCSLFKYWDQLRGDAIAPARVDVCPSDIRHILADVFLLQRYDNNRFAYRLAGSQVCRLYRRELKGQPLLSSWNKDAQSKLMSAISSVAEKGQILHVESIGTNSQGQTIGLEWLFLPLYHEDTGFTRIIGACATLDVPYWVGTDAVLTQEPLYMNLMSADVARQQLSQNPGSGERSQAPLPIVALQQRIESHFGRRRPWTLIERKNLDSFNHAFNAPNFNVVPFAPVKRRVRHLTVFEGG